jgi:hypothetical protein
MAAAHQGNRQQHQQQQSRANSSASVVDSSSTTHNGRHGATTATPTKGPRRLQKGLLVLLLCSVAATSAAAAGATAVPTDGTVPVRGWNSWNTFRWVLQVTPVQQCMQHMKLVETAILQQWWMLLYCFPSASRGTAGNWQQHI